MGKAADGAAKGVFAAWQPEYAKYGLPTFPVGPEKIPSIRGYLKVGLLGSEKLVQQFGSTAAFGVKLGQRTGLTVFDIDSPDERLLNQCLDRHGPTPIVIRTGSGNFQAWYRYNGERRLIRPHPDLPIDILGCGFVVAPPSQIAAGEYRFLQGALTDLSSLPVIRNLGFLVQSSCRSSPGRLHDGERNRKLFSHALKQARYTDDEASLLDVVQTENENSCEQKLEAAEIKKITSSAWSYEEKGLNLSNLGYVPATYNEIDDLAAKSPDALALLLLLRRVHTRRDHIYLAQAFADRLHWTRRRFRKARQALQDCGLIKCLHPGGLGKSDPPIFRLAPVKHKPRV